MINQIHTLIKITSLRHSLMKGHETPNNYDDDTNFSQQWLTYNSNCVMFFGHGSFSEINCYSRIWYS